MTDIELCRSIHDGSVSTYVCGRADVVVSCHLKLEIQVSIIEFQDLRINSRIQDLTSFDHVHVRC
jgi:hypothetical protein